MATRRNSYDLPPIEREVEVETVTDPFLGQSTVSWGAILAGGAVALGLQLLLGLAGIAAGLMTLPSVDNPNTLGMSALAWWGGSAALSLLIGGYTAGVLCGSQRGIDGVLHGLSLWALTILLLVFLTTSSILGVLSGALSVITGVASGATQAAAQAAGQAAGNAVGADTGVFDRAIDQLLGPSIGADPSTLTPEQARSELVAALPKLLQSGPEADAARDRAVAIIAARTHQTPEEARARLDQMVTTARTQRDELAAQARTAANRARQYAATGSVYGAIALAVSGLVALIGGLWGSRQNV